MHPAHRCLKTEYILKKVKILWTKTIITTGGVGALTHFVCFFFLKTALESFSSDLSVKKLWKSKSKVDSFSREINFTAEQEADPLVTLSTYFIKLMEAPYLRHIWHKSKCLSVWADRGEGNNLAGISVHVQIFYSTGVSWVKSRIWRS